MLPEGATNGLPVPFLPPVLPPPTLTASPSPLPRRHRVRISPQAFLGLSCFGFEHHGDKSGSHFTHAANGEYQ